MRHLFAGLLVLAACGGTARAQVPFTYQLGVPTTNGTPAVAKTCYRGLSGTNAICITAPSSISAGATLTLPAPTGSAGCVQDSTGAGVLVISACGLTVPATLSGTSSGPLLSLVQSGTGPALYLQGSLAFSADNSFYIGSISLAPNTIYAHTLSHPSQLWTLGATGLGFAQDYTSRYVFNSIGDVPQTGTANTSGTTITATSGSFDTSWVGGQILICPGGCTGTNGSLYLVSAWVSSTQLTLATSPGTLTAAGYSYQANAFQTSQGTMYITGTGFGYMQNMVVTNGFTAIGGSTLSGNVTCASSTCVLNSGSKFNPSMVGGNIYMNSTYYRVLTVTSDHGITVTPGGATFTSAYTITPNAFQTNNGAAYIDSLGNATFYGLAAQNGATISGLLGVTGAVQSQSLLVNGAYGITSGGALTVTSCSGCSGGVASFNTRTGAVTLSKADVTAVDQALGTADSPSFASLSASTSGIALTGTTTGAGTGVYGVANAGFAGAGVYGTAGGSGYGVHAQNTSSGTALYVENGSTGLGAEFAYGNVKFDSGVSIAGVLNLLNGVTIQGNGGANWYITGGGAAAFQTVNGTFYSSFSVPGVSCSGSPSGSFASTNGIVTHC